MRLPQSPRGEEGTRSSFRNKCRSFSILTWIDSGKGLHRRDPKLLTQDDLLLIWVDMSCSCLPLTQVDLAHPVGVKRVTLIWVDHNNEES